MKSSSLLPLALGLLSACAGGGEAPVCGQAECAAVCPGATPTHSEGGTTLSLSPFEAEVLGPQLDDLRAGVRPFDERSVGVCVKGSGRECGEVLGSQAGELAPGEYMLFGAFAVPNGGEEGTWTVTLKLDCEATDASGDVSSRSREKSYDVKYSGPDRAYRLAPLDTITSPAPKAETCTWSMALGGPTAQQTLTGGWSVPAAS